MLRNTVTSTDFKNKLFKNIVRKVLNMLSRTISANFSTLVNNININSININTKTRTNIKTRQAARQLHFRS